MSCANQTIYTYEVYEYDGQGRTEKNNKIVTLNPTKYSSYDDYTKSEQIILAVFKQLFDTINLPSGFSSSREGGADDMDVIIIKWRIPQWKLVRIK